jgi:hypothetical protein
MSKEFIRYSGSLMIDSPTNYGSYPDDGSEIEYNYYPYFLAQQIYQTPTGQQEQEGELVIHPFQTVYEEPFITSGNELMYVR